MTRKLLQELHVCGSSDEPSQDRYSCALANRLTCCDGAGYVLDMSGTHTRADLCTCVKSCPTCFGRARKTVDGISVACRSPNPSRIVNILNAAGIPSRYGTAELKGFANFTGNGKDIQAFMVRWLHDFNLKKSKGIILGGGVGVGKTFLLAALAKNLALKELSIKFVDFFQLLNELKAGYAANKADDDLLQPLINVDILIIDELGKGRNTEWEQTIIDQLVMGRYNQNKIIIASTNYGLKPEHRLPKGFNVPLDQGGESRAGEFNSHQFKSLETRIGSRIYSRFIETSQCIELTGEDFRKTFIKSPQAHPTIAPRS